MLEYLLFGSALVLSGIASFTDLKTREVPNAISFGMIGLFLTIRVFHAWTTASWTPFLYTLGVGGAFLALGLSFFYMQQWGGADVKLLVAYGIGFGTLLPGLTPSVVAAWPFAVTLLVNFFIVAVFYSVAYSFLMASGDPRVALDFKASMHKYEPAIGLLLFFAAVAMATQGNRLFLWAALLPTFWFLTKFLRVVEKHCMHKVTPVQQLVEFDIPQEDVVVDGKLIVSKKDPNGMTLEHVSQIRKFAAAGKLSKRLSVRWGVPLIPAFPIALLVSVLYGDVMFSVVRWLVQ